MKQGLLIGLLVLFLISCGKDKFQSEPQLTLNKVSSTLIPVGFDLQVNMRLTDQEGDFNDVIYVQKITTRCPNSNFVDSMLYRIPGDVPRSTKFDAEVIVTFAYALGLQPQCTQPDTAVFSFWMKDAANHVSDTVHTPPIVILRP
jgi:hypothetical protein